MSKKVLNYAGRRPMLLALIMATLTLGLLFSGWFTPTPMQAQTGGGNPSSGNENTNCPSYSYETNTSCPWITTSPQITTPSFCLKKGDPVPDPSYAPAPAAAPGSVVITTTETCSNIVTTSSNSFTYTFGKMYFVPPKPSSSAVGTHTSECHIPVTSGNTNCTPGDLDIGSVTWTIVDPTPVPGWIFKVSPSAALSALTTFTAFTPCNPNTPTASGEISATYSDKCCHDQKISVTTISGSASASGGMISCYWPIPGFSIELPTEVVGLCAYASASAKVKVGGSGTINDCDGANTVCGTVSVTIQAAGGVALVLFNPNIFSVTGALQVSAGGDGKVCFNSGGLDSGGFEACVYNISAIGTVTIIGGIQFSKEVLVLKDKICTPYMSF